MSFDMNQCKKGDKLICRDGCIVEYLNVTDALVYRHQIQYFSGCNGTRTDTGACYSEGGSSSDITGFYKKEKDMNTFDIKDLKTGMKVTLKNGEQVYIFEILQDYRAIGKPVMDKYVQYISSYYGWDYLEAAIKKHGEVIKVEHADNFFKILSRIKFKDSTLLRPCKWTTIWEKLTADLSTTSEQIKQQELQAKYDAAKKELEELGRAIGVVE